MPDHTAVTNTVLYAMTQAYCDGEKAALALKRGDVFLGAYGAASAAGYDEHSLEFASFVSGFLQGLETSYVDGDTLSKRHVVVDTNNIIISITEVL